MRANERPVLDCLIAANPRPLGTADLYRNGVLAMEKQEISRRPPGSRGAHSMIWGAWTEERRS